MGDQEAMACSTPRKERTPMRILLSAVSCAGARVGAKAVTAHNKGANKAARVVCFLIRDMVISISLNGNKKTLCGVLAKPPGIGIQQV